MALLEVKDLGVSFATPDGTVNAVNGGERSRSTRARRSASLAKAARAKSQLSFAIMGLLAQRTARRGRIGPCSTVKEILNAPPNVINPIRANKIAMVFQDPMTSLNPYMRVADQMAEVLIHHKGGWAEGEAVKRGGSDARCGQDPRRQAAGSGFTRTNFRAECGNG